MVTRFSIAKLHLSWDKVCHKSMLQVVYFVVQVRGHIKQKTTVIIYLIGNFYPTALMGCRGIVFTHGVRAGGGKKFVRPVSRKP